MGCKEIFEEIILFKTRNWPLQSPNVHFNKCV